MKLPNNINSFWLSNLDKLSENRLSRLYKILTTKDKDKLNKYKADEIKYQIDLKVKTDTQIKSNLKKNFEHIKQISQSEDAEYLKSLDTKINQI